MWPQLNVCVFVADSPSACCFLGSSSLWFFLVLSQTCWSLLLDLNSFLSATIQNVPLAQQRLSSPVTTVMKRVELTEDKSFSAVSHVGKARSQILVKVNETK